MSILAVIISLLPTLLKLVMTFIKTPEQDRQKMIDELVLYNNNLRDAISKAIREKDPTDLSKLINR